MSRRLALAALMTASVAIAAAACGRQSFLGGGGGGGPTPSGTLTATPTPSVTPTLAPDPTRFPTPAPTPTLGASFGNSSDGSTYTVSTTEVVNVCVPVAAASNQLVAFTRAPGAGFYPGSGTHAYLLWQVQSVTLTSAGDPSPVADVNGSGLWEIVHLSSAPGTTSTTIDEASMVYRYRSLGDGRAQMCHVPEWGSVNVNSGAKIHAPPWDGETGGVAALMVNGNFNLSAGNTAIDANGDGFRGGTPGAFDMLPNGSVVETLDSLVETTGGSKGESLDVRGWVHHGTGAFTIGAGGGNDDCGGGGGGGNGGQGGGGGSGIAGGNTAGEGGNELAPADLAPTRLVMGAGGAGGATHHASTAVGAGGNGGGLILVFAKTVQNAGVFTANGGNGTANPTDGAGGGGAGGTVLLVTSGTDAWTGTMQAKGGAGQLAGSNCGSSGGGAGGQVMLVGKMGAGHCLVPGSPAGTGGGANDGGGGASGQKGSIGGTCPN